MIGLTTIHTKTTSSPSDDTEFLDPVQVLQRTVDEINAKENVDRIVAMTHIGASYSSVCRDAKKVIILRDLGYAEDVDLAARTRGVHLILGKSQLHSAVLSYILGIDRDSWQGDIPILFSVTSVKRRVHTPPYRRTLMGR